MLRRRPPEGDGDPGGADVQRSCSRARRNGRTPRRGAPAALKGSGRAGRSRTARRRPLPRCAAYPLGRLLARAHDHQAGPDPRPSVAPRAPRSRARRLVRPTTTRSVATDSALRRRSCSFSSAWREPSSTMPGVTTTRRAESAPTSLQGGQAARGRRRGWRCRCRRARRHRRRPTDCSRRCGATGSVGSLPATSSTGTPSSSATATAAATLLGRGLDGAPPRRRLRPPARTRESAVALRRRTHDIRAVGSRAETRHDPGARSAQPSRPAPPGGRRRRRAPRTARPARISALACDDAVLGAEALEVHRADGGDHRHVGTDPRAQLGDLPAPVGPHLRHEDLGPVGQVLVDGPGQPGPVVEAGGAGHHRTGPAHQVGDVSLGARLPERAGDGDHLGCHPPQTSRRAPSRGWRPAGAPTGAVSAQARSTSAGTARAAAADRHRALPRPRSPPPRPPPRGRPTPAPRCAAAASMPRGEVRPRHGRPDGPHGHHGGGGEHAAGQRDESTSPATATASPATLTGAEVHHRRAKRDTASTT